MRDGVGFSEFILSQIYAISTWIGAPPMAPSPTPENLGVDGWKPLCPPLQTVWGQNTFDRLQRRGSVDTGMCQFQRKAGHRRAEGELTLVVNQVRAACKIGRHNPATLQEPTTNLLPSPPPQGLTATCWKKSHTHTHSLSLSHTHTHARSDDYT